MKGHLVNKYKTQSGFAHLAILTVILTIALIGALGFVYYQSFIEDNPEAISKDGDNSDKDGTDQKVEVKYKTFTDTKYNLSFQYPDNWSLGEISAVLVDDPYWNRSMVVKDENSEVVATLVIGVSGLGGTCDGHENDLPSYKVLDSTESSIKSSKPVVASFILYPVDAAYSNSGYRAYYGLQDKHITKDDFKACLFYNLFTSSLKNNSGNEMEISFGNGVVTNNGKFFSNIEDANNYINSDKYQAIKKMILSLKY